MAIYAKKLNGKQRAMLKEYENLSGFEPIGQEDLDTGKIDFKELWKMNIDFIFNILADIQNINSAGTGAYK